MQPFTIVFIIIGLALAIGAITMVVITHKKKKAEQAAAKKKAVQELKAQQLRDSEAKAEEDRLTGYSHNSGTHEAEIQRDANTLELKQAAARANHPTYYRRRDLREAEAAGAPNVIDVNSAAYGALIASSFANEPNPQVEAQQDEIEELKAEIEELKEEVPSFEREVSEPEPIETSTSSDTAPASSDDWSSSFEPETSSSSSSWDSGFSSSSSSSDSSSSSSSSWSSSSSDSGSSWSSSSDSGSSFSGGSDW